MFPLRDSIRSSRIPFVTWLLLLANVWVFFLELSGGESFITRFALTPSTISGDLASWYPFVTSMFLHGGWFHLFSNMWFLWIFGDNVESALGKLGYLFFYLACGIIAAFVQYIASPGSVIPMLGASGAIAGVLGAYVILFPHAYITSLVVLGFYVTVIDIPAIVYLPYWFVLQLLAGVGQIGQVAISGGVAFLAHVGGFVAGVVGATFIKLGRATNG